MAENNLNEAPVTSTTSSTPQGGVLSKRTILIALVAAAVAAFVFISLNARAAEMQPSATPTAQVLVR